MWQKNPLTTCNVVVSLVFGFAAGLFATPSFGQMQQYYNPHAGTNMHPAYQQHYGYNQPAQTRRQGPPANLQYDGRDAERILRDQMALQRGQMPGSRQRAPGMYDNYYSHRIQDEDQVRVVMNEAKRIGAMIPKRNGKAFIVIDKRNFQFYLYSRDARLLRIGPVAIGKGKTRVGHFETPVGVFPIKKKVPVDDWTRPDWYFIEEGEPIPTRHQDRIVRGFFRYKMVFDGTRYIHYAEATGGRLTHGCLGLDWQDAEAAFHTLSVGSYCVIIDEPFLTRLARGEFPIVQRAKKPKKKKVPAIVLTPPLETPGSAETSGPRRASQTTRSNRAAGGESVVSTSGTTRNTSGARSALW